VLFKKNNPDNLGIGLFTQAFIYGANLPFIMAFTAVLLISFFGQEDSPFLVGAFTFLIYSSTAANIFMDRYARPFLLVCRDGCPQITSPTVGSAQGTHAA